MNKQEEKFLLYGAGALFVYFAILRPILIKIGLQKDPERIATEERKQSQLEQQIEEVAKKEKPTKSTEEWQIIADKIYTDLRNDALFDDKASAGYQVARVKNNADFWLLFKLFAKRREYFYGIPNGPLMNLAEFIQSNLSKEAIGQINKNYKSKNITFQF